MTSYEPSLDNAELLKWEQADAALPQPRVLLLGNGGSRAIWNGFGYESLFEIAVESVPHPLTEEAQELFAQLGGSDFERVLGSLLTSRRVNEALGVGTRAIRSAYRGIQLSLREAIGESHVPWGDVESETLALLRKEYRRHAAVYTTNYDLVLYWAVMHTNPAGEFDDYFRGAPLTFDPLRARLAKPGEETSILYLHGAIHLRRTAEGIVRKEKALQEHNLLALFQFPVFQDETPLIVTEGASNEKIRSIQETGYLAFALDRLAEDDRPMVIFGHRLGHQDEHIVRAVNAHDARSVAISVRATADVAARKREIAQRLRAGMVMFFDAGSHPLGSPQLMIHG